MAFIDEIKIIAKAGKGGNGVVRWLHERGKEFGGPSGGNGGKGGDVYMKAVRELTLLASYRGHKPFIAENGEDGMRDSMHGKNAEDLFIKVPIGSVVTNLKTGEVFRFDEDDETHMILKGGRGGLGNEYFKSSRNTTPEESTNGTEGEEGEFFISLEMFADVGLIGLPSAGKSSLLNAITNTNAKVGGYDFTTLEPNLGSFFGYIIADIPGLIEGASQGKGLGIKFLKHIKRTKILVHLVASDNPDPKKSYEVIRNELKAFDKTILDKKEILVLSKSDNLDKETLKEKLREFKKINKEVRTISILDDNSIKDFKEFLVQKLKEEK